MPRNVLLSRVAVMSMLVAGSVICGGAVTRASAVRDDMQPTTPAPTVWLVDKTGKGMMKQACGEDVKKLCPGVQRGEGRIMQCLKQHAKEVSENCGKLLERRAKKGEKQQAPQPQ
jgi:hypothetical protein